MNKEKIFHIYARDKCVYHSLSQTEFNTIWKMMNNLIDVLDTKELKKEDLTYEEVVMDKELSLSSSH
jgi:hypothetical protein